MKNKFMRIAAVMLMLCLVTTCAISGTFAKYTTKSTGTDNARVAYWGWNAPADLAIDLFDGTYTNVTSKGDVDGFTNVIAPGTSKTDTFAFGYTNYKSDKIEAPEVAYTFTVDATMEGDFDSLDANTNFYWTLDGNKYQTAAELIAAIKLLSGNASGSKDYAAGELPDAFTDANETYTIGWNWVFTTDAAGDAADTAMGNSQTLENVTFKITISATQK